MKALGLVLLVTVSFAATLTGLLAASGRLSRETIEALLKHPQPVVAPQQAADDVGPLANALRARKEELDARQADLDAREKRIAQMLADLEELRTDIDGIRKDIQRSLDSIDEDRGERMASVAKSLSEMKPENAAKALADWPIDEAASVLGQIREKERGKILDSMDSGKAAVLLQALQEKKL
ncbi:MAG TPA: hypothetical protein PLO37_13690 [Candidatus Hydrogenedentes bacterium]|nr:hypothetical protein [Candidatus Hydrogenedentota bacterium]HPG67897.1 hypothetical protein [Candidatus Hydrogenedentota bacterium]